MKRFLALFLFSLFIIPPCFSEISQTDRILRAQVLKKAGDNYINDVKFNNEKILRWNKGYFPIKVYFKTADGVPNYYNVYAKQGAFVWQKETKGTVQLKFVEDEKNADIIIKILNENSPDDTMAYTEHYSNWFNMLTHAYISLYKKDKKGKFYTPREIYNVVVHEFGHAIGLCGHTKIKTSVMSEYYSVENSKTPPILDAIDLNTIRFLYKIEPDITNGDKRKDTDNWIKPKKLFL